MQDLKGKVVVITGASSGIGEATAVELAQMGVKVVLGARREQKLEQIVASIKKNGGNAAYAATDITKRDDLIALVRLATDHFGKLDAIVNNAGVARISRIDELDLDDWDEMIDVNVKGVLYGMAAAIPVFKEQRHGHIINIISTAGIKIVPTQGVYAATKNTVRTISEAFRQESDGTIRVTGISPGYINTEFAEKSVQTQEMRDAAKATVARIAISPKAVAEAVVYTLSQPRDVEIGDIVIRPAAQN